MAERNPIAELQARKEKLLAGDAEKQAARKKEGKLSARERVGKLLDQASFVETDALVAQRVTAMGGRSPEAPYEGVVTGYGTIQGRPVAVYAQDFTVLGGSVGEMHAKKIVKIMDLAMKTGMPVIALLDSAGARIEEGIEALNAYGAIFKASVQASGVVPQIALVMGSCAGGASISPALSDIVIMVEKTAQMFTTGPQVVSALTGADVTAETLGGAKKHAASGTAHFVAANEDGALALARQIVEMLPANNVEDAPWQDTGDDLNRVCAELDEIYDKGAYDVRSVIGALLDGGALVEFSAAFAKNIVTGLGRMGGYAVGVVANQPAEDEGRIDAAACRKAAGFVRFCDSFNIPVVVLTNTPGSVLGTVDNQSDLMRDGAKLIYAFAEATVPMLNVILGKAVMTGYNCMCSKAVGADMVYAWPTAEVSVLPAEAAAVILNRDEIAASADPVAARAQAAEKIRQSFSSPYQAAELGVVDDVILPSQTRQMLLAALGMLAGKRGGNPPKKHGNLPL